MANDNTIQHPHTPDTTPFAGYVYPVEVYQINGCFSLADNLDNITFAKVADIEMASPDGTHQGLVFYENFHGFKAVVGAPGEYNADITDDDIIEIPSVAEIAEHKLDEAPTLGEDNGTFSPNFSPSAFCPPVLQCVNNVCVSRPVHIHDHPECTTKGEVCSSADLGELNELGDPECDFYGDANMMYDTAGTFAPGPYVFVPPAGTADSGTQQYHNKEGNIRGNNDSCICIDKDVDTTVAGDPAELQTGGPGVGLDPPFVDICCIDLLPEVDGTLISELAGEDDSSEIQPRRWHTPGETDFVEKRRWHTPGETDFVIMTPNGFGLKGLGQLLYHLLPTNWGNLMANDHKGFDDRTIFHPDQCPEAQCSNEDGSSVCGDPHVTTFFGQKYDM